MVQNLVFGDGVLPDPVREDEATAEIGSSGGSWLFGPTAGIE